MPWTRTHSAWFKLTRSDSPLHMMSHTCSAWSECVSLIVSEKVVLRVVFGDVAVRVTIWWWQSLCTNLVAARLIGEDKVSAYLHLPVHTALKGLSHSPQHHPHMGPQGHFWANLTILSSALCGSVFCTWTDFSFRKCFRPMQTICKCFAVLGCMQIPSREDEWRAKQPRPLWKLGVY